MRDDPITEELRRGLRDRVIPRAKGARGRLQEHLIRRGLLAPIAGTQRLMPTLAGAIEFASRR